MSTIPGTGRTRGGVGEGVQSFRSDLLPTVAAHSERAGLEAFEGLANLRARPLTASPQCLAYLVVRFDVAVGAGSVLGEGQFQRPTESLGEIGRQWRCGGTGLAGMTG
jgi:hypothetical protein